MSKEKNLTLQQMFARQQANCNRIEEIAETCQREQRERTEAEEAEYRSLVRDNQQIEMRAQAQRAPEVRTRVSATAQLRELVSAPNPSRSATIVLTREGEAAAGEGAPASAASALMTTASLEGTGIIPVSEQEMLKPLRAGLIYDLVGLNIRSGLAAGSLRWPKHTKAVAQFADEGERLADAKVDFDKLTVAPRRLGVAIPVTREDLESSQGVVENVIREEMPASVVDLINEVMFTTEKTFTDKDGNTKNRKITGPFVAAAEEPFEFAGEVPTRKELLKMKAKVTAAGIKLTNAAWVMTETMKAELEDTKVDQGSGRFVCENDSIFGIPVFTTPFIGEGNVGFGEWSYQAAGFFGQTSITVDPYTLARQNATDFVLNAHFATATLCDEAFVLGHKKAAKA